MNLTQNYRVVKGDSLWKLALAHLGNPLRWQELARLNNIGQPYTIFVGQTLKLPSRVGGGGNSTVQAPAASTVRMAAPAPSVVRTPTPSMVRPPATVGLPAPTTVSAPAPSTIRTPAPAASTVTKKPVPTSGNPVLEAMKAARPVAYPALKYKFSDLPKVEIVTPAFKATLQMKGEITVQRKGVLAELELSNEGVTQKLKAEVDSEFSKLTSGAAIKVQEGKAAELKFELAVASKVNGAVFMTQKVAVIPPTTVRYTLEPQSIAGEHDPFVFKGTFGYQLDVTPNISGPQPQAQPVVSPSPQEVSKWVGVVLLVAAGGIIVGTIVEDVLTAGAGVADDPISFGAAAALARTGLTAF